MLDEKVGDPFRGALAHLQHGRILRAVTGTLIQNMCETAGLGLQLKLMTGVQLCDSKVLDNPRLKASLEAIVARKFGSTQAKDDSLSLLVMKVAKALSYSPSRMHEGLVQQIRAVSDDLTAPMLVELVSFLATVQMVHRIESYYHLHK